jgi:hypothetical protein
MREIDTGLRVIEMDVCHCKLLMLKAIGEAGSGDRKRRASWSD